MPATIHPSLTLIIPHYNHQEHLPKLLDSVRAQQMESLEVIVVDDCSEQPCTDIVDAYAHHGLHIRLIQHTRRRGMKNSRLTGIMHAKGDVIGFADSDDSLFGTHALKKHTHLMLNECADIVHFNSMWHYTSSGTQRVNTWAAPYALQLTGQEILSAYVHSGLAGHTIWNKLYSKKICQQVLAACPADTIINAQEDLYLSSWFLFFAQRYRGSEDVGYTYMYQDWEMKQYARAPGGIITCKHLTDDILPILKNSCPAELVDKWLHHINNILYSNIKLFHSACFAQNKTTGEMLQSLTLQEDTATLLAACNTLLPVVACSTQQTDISALLHQCIDALKSLRHLR